MNTIAVLRRPGNRAPATLRAAIAAIALLCAPTLVNASSLTIDATFDSSLTSADDAAIDAAIANIEANISSPNNITVNIYFDSMSSGLGESESSIYDPSYYDYYNAYKAVATSAVQLEALASLGTAPTLTRGVSSGNPVNGNPEITVTSAECRNLGLENLTGPGYGTSRNPTPSCQGSVNVGGNNYDGEVLLNTSITSPPNTLGSDTYSLQAVATHEIDEVLGIGGAGSTLTGTGSLTGPVGDLDLYRYDADGTRSYSNEDPNQPYLSYNGGLTVVSYFQQVSGEDFGDWESDPQASGYGVQVQDAVGTPGTSPTLGSSEITAFNMIGYEVVAPEPSTLALVGLGLLGFGLLRRRRGTRDAMRGL